jgi:hypothetical protein
MLLHQPSGLKYVGSTGNVALRGRQHAIGNSNDIDSPIGEALAPFKKLNADRTEWIFCPLWYALDDISKTTAKRKVLLTIEDELITAYDAISRGYNREKRGNPKASLNSFNPRGCKHINNGNVSRFLPAGEPLPPGWKYGRTIKGARYGSK